MRRASALAVALLLLVLAGCAGMPTSGTVNPGRDPLDAGEDPSVAFVPDGPQPGASPDQIVEGFLRAGTGTQSGWAIARQFLTEQFAGEWVPSATVTVDRLSDRATDVRAEDDNAAAVTATVSAAGIVDSSGAYAPQSASASEVPFELVREDGEWRISRAQDGIVLSEEQFRTVYRSATLAYFGRDWQYLVPDVRWFPRTNTATWVANALLEEPPTPWLAGAARTAFPDDIAAPTVSTSDGTVQVELGESALGLGAETLGRMQAQLDETFRSIDQPAVQMTVDGSPLVATPATTRSTRVDPDSLVQLAIGPFGFVDGDGAAEVPGLSAAIESIGVVEAVETGPERDAAAVLTAAGTVVRATDETVVLDARTALVAPSIDPFGTIWSVPSGEPSATRAFPVDGDPIDVAGAWPEATSVRAVQVSRDGARIAALVTVRGRTELWASGIRRDDGVIGLGEPMIVTTELGEGLDLAWLDDTTVGVLERVDGDLRLRQQTVGGPGTDLTVPEGSLRIVGGNGTPRLLTDAGTVYVRQGTVWQQTAQGVAVLAAQQGAPAP